MFGFAGKTDVEALALIEKARKVMDEQDVPTEGRRVRIGLKQARRMEITITEQDRRNGYVELPL
jgi:hypothetical protein